MEDREGELNARTGGGKHIGEKKYKGCPCAKGEGQDRGGGDIERSVHGGWGGKGMVWIRYMEHSRQSDRSVRWKST